MLLEHCPGGSLRDLCARQPDCRISEAIVGIREWCFCVNREPLRFGWDLIFPFKRVFLYDILYTTYIYIYMVHTWWVVFFWTYEYGSKSDIYWNIWCSIRNWPNLAVGPIFVKKNPLSPGQSVLVLCSDLTGNQTWALNGGSRCLVGWFIFFVEGCVGIEVMIWKKANMLRSTPILGHAAYNDFI